MTKRKKLAAVVLCMLLMACMPLLLFGCSTVEEDPEEEQTYDVAIRVGCSDGMIYEFPVGEDEKHVTIPYDGEERTFWVDSYNLPDHPRYGDDWFAPSGEGANVFGSNLGKVHQMYDEEPPEYVCEKGEYFYSVYASSTSTIWNFRSVCLYITIV